MKKQHKFLEKEDLEKLITKRLLSYKNKLYKLIPSLYETLDGCNCHDCAEIYERRKFIKNKIEEVKQILNKREHIVK